VRAKIASRDSLANTESEDRSRPLAEVVRLEKIAEKAFFRSPWKWSFGIGGYVNSKTRGENTGCAPFSCQGFVNLCQGSRKSPAGFVSQGPAKS